jgi:hypothetical protein
MMPQVLSVRVRSGEIRRVRLWIPILPVVILLAPVIVLALIVALVALAVLRINPVRGLRAGLGMVAAVRGLRLAISSGDLTVHVRVR